MDGGQSGFTRNGHSLSSMSKNLVWSACALVRAGHAQVFDYPWPVFLIAVDELSASLKRK